MTLPSNWQSTTSRSVSRTPPILFCALVGATLTLFLLLLKSRVLGQPALIFWEQSSPNAKFFLVVSAPYLLSIVLLLIPSFYARTFASGVVGATAAVFIYWEGLFLVLLAIAIPFYNNPSMRGTGPPPGPIALLVFFSLLCQLTAFVSALVLFFRGSREIPAFLAGILVAAIYAGGVYHAQQSSQANYFKALDDVDQESTVALKTVESISWCAIEFASQHSSEGYPASLGVISGNPICKRSWSVSAIPHYSVTYSPSRDASGRVTAFSVKAVAAPNPLRAPKNAQSDESGVALIEYQDPHDTRYPAEIGTLVPLDDIRMNEVCFRDYAQHHEPLGFPRKFGDVPNCYNAFRQYGSSFLSDNAIQSGKYLFLYLPSAPDRSGKVHSYRLQINCQDYGISCLHSFLLTDRGQLFVTTANRPATTQDSLLPSCPRQPPIVTFCLQGE